MTIERSETERYLVRPGEKLRLSAIPADSTGRYTGKKQARAELKPCRKEIDRLARILAIEGKRSVLIVLQGVDASGKDGAVRHVFTGVNPQMCKVTSFVEPDAEERSHGFLWRIYRAAPAAGELAVFNRSHYEDVLVPRARGILSIRDTRMRIRQMADFERTWAENGIVMRKFLLHISRDEQARRFQARLDTPDKHWKVKASDFSDRRLWPQFERAYEDAIARTARQYAPWYIIPSDHKWYRDIAIASVLLDTLRSLNLTIPHPKIDRGKFKI